MSTQTKFVKEGPDKKGRTFIIEVKEDKATMTRYVQRFICEVGNQETEEQTQEVADLLVKKLNQ